MFQESHQFDNEMRIKMINQSHVNLLNLISGEFKRVAATNGGTYHGACPLCGGKDRFCIQPNAANGGRWFCRNCHPKWGDPIAWIAHLEGLKLKQHEDLHRAMQILNIQPDEYKKQSSSSKLITKIPSYLSFIPSPYISDNKKWRDSAGQFTHSTHHYLMSPEGVSARNYLHKRGISDKVMIQHSLGFVGNNAYRNHWHDAKIYIPPFSITIPYFFDGQVSAVRYRNQGTYKWALGSNAKLCFGMDELFEAQQAILVESELCSLVLKSQSNETLSTTQTVPIALGGASGGRGISSLARLAIPAKVFIALDNDDAGDKASRWWLENLPHSIRVIPTQKDIGDMYTANDGINSWLKQFIQG